MSKAREAIGLIVGDGPRHEEIAEVLTREGFTPASFDGVRAILEAEVSGGLSAIVVWIEHSTFSSVPRLVEPLTKRFVSSPVVVVCASIQRWEVRAVLLAGAAGVIVSDDLESTLGPCLRAVRVGQPLRAARLLAAN